MQKISFVRNIVLIVSLILSAPLFAEKIISGDPKPAMIIFTQVNDGGWSQALDEARQRMEKDLGISIPVVENVPENAAAIKPPAELFIDRGFNIILGSAFGYSDAFKELTEKYPDVVFLNPAGRLMKNLMGYYGRTYESQYLCGMAAGAMSKTGKLGFVAANHLVWSMDSERILAWSRTMDPDATLNVIFTGAWNDPVGKSRGAALIEQGVDVLGQHVDTPTPQIVAAK